MKYGIVGRIGSDYSKIKLEADDVADLRIGCGAENDVNIADFLRKVGESGLAPGRVVRDFLAFAALVYVADTRIDRTLAEDGWTRQISLNIPVKDVDKWRIVAPELQRALNFLTGDRWQFVFRESKYALKVVLDDEAEAEDAAHVALFSGGLDSFIGALDLVADGKPIYLVGHYGFDPSASVSQNAVVQHVVDRRRKNQKVTLLHGRIAAKSNVFGWGSDRNERARSLMFIAMGLLAAEGVGAARLCIPENGLISLNVPLTTLRVGTYSTRTTHPNFIGSLQNVLDGLGIRVELDNPYRFSTKGEMLLGCKAKGDLLSICADTMSCAHPSQGRYARRPMTHCGRCTACIIRRAAFQRAFKRDETSYILDDLIAKPLRSDLASEGKDIRAIRLAAQRVRNAPGLAPFLVLKPGPLPQGTHPRYADLYKRGMDELWEVVKDVRTLGSL